MTNETVIAILSELKKCYLGGVVDALDFAIKAVKEQEHEALDMPKPDSDIGCWYDITHNYTLEQVVSALKAQEPPTDVSISSAIECLLHPQDADGSDMAKAIDVAVKALKLLKAQEPGNVNITITQSDGWKEGNCPFCGMKVDSFYNWSFCGTCGKGLEWE